MIASNPILNVQDEQLTGEWANAEPCACSKTYNKGLNWWSTEFT
jgi:hypothetical protein